MIDPKRIRKYARNVSHRTALFSEQAQIMPSENTLQRISGGLCDLNNSFQTFTINPRAWRNGGAPLMTPTGAMEVVGSNPAARAKLWVGPFPKSRRELSSGQCRK